MQTEALLTAILFLAAGANAAADLPEHTPRPGGIAIVPVGTGELRPTVEFGGKKTLLLRDGNAWLAVVGIPLATPAGAAELSVHAGEERLSSVVEFEVIPHGYREQRLNVERSYVEPDSAQLERIFSERKVIDAALNNYRDIDVGSLSLPAPVPGKRSPSFGFRRFFNDQPRSPHSGMDIAAPLGTEIRAPVGGVVTATGHYFFNGNTVIVDHGQGFVTMYCHLERIDVGTDETVESGHTLGIVGATGRVTGAHLHFGTYLNGTAIDPALLLEAN
jgi:murein DD-endopeptidase MepM/ murein hydrolase activator NlpD